MKRPWMPLYVADYLADTGHLTGAEHGAYLLLIMHYWANEGLPVDDAKLARIARMTEVQWKRSKPIIQGFFSSEWKHGRIELEMTEAARLSVAGRKGGVASGKARRERSLNGRSEIVADPFNDSTNDSGTNREALQSQSQKKEVCANAHTARARKTPFSDDFVPDRELPRSLGWSEGAIDQQIERFRDSARAHKRLYADWPAAWRNWCRSPYQTAKKNGSRKEIVREKWDDADEKLQQFIDGASSGIREAAQGLLPSSGHGES